MGTFRLLNLPRIGVSSIRREVSGALAGSLVSLPQSLGLGLIAFAPLGPDYLAFGMIAGVMSSIVVTFVSSVVGGTQGMLCGPRASIAIVFAAVLAATLDAGLVSGDREVQAGFALMLALSAGMLAGFLQLLFGVLRLGEMIRNMPYSISAGFVNAAALLIVVSQIQTVFDLPSGLSLDLLADRMGLDYLGRLAVVVAAVAAILMAQRLLPRIFSLLVGVLVGCVAYYALLIGGMAADLGGTFPPVRVNEFVLSPLPDMTAAGQAILSAVITGAEAVRWDGVVLDWAFFGTVAAIILPAVISIAVLQSLDTLFSISVWDDMTNRRSRPNTELVAQGAGSVLCSWLGYFPSSGSMVRTHAMWLSGGRTAWAALGSCVILIVLLIGLTPLFQFIPKIAVSGILFVIAFQLVDRWSLSIFGKFLRGDATVRRLLAADVIIIVAVVASALILGFVAAVVIGLGIAILEFLIRMSRSPIRRILRGDTIHSHFLRSEADARLLEKHGAAIAVVELEGAFFFGSVGQIERTIDTLQQRGVVFLILDLKRVRALDSTAVRLLTRVHRRLAHEKGEMLVSYVQEERRKNSSPGPFSGPKDRRKTVSNREKWRSLDHFGGLAEVGKARFFDDTESALRVCEDRLLDRLKTAGRADTALGQGLPPILKGLTRRQRRIIRQRAHRIHYGGGDMVFRQGDDGDTVYLLVRGKLDVLLSVGDSGRRMRVSTLGPGAVFGEMAWLDPMPRSATIEAIEDCVCYGISARDLEELIDEHPQISAALLKNMSLIFTRRLRAANLAMIELES